MNMINSHEYLFHVFDNISLRETLMRRFSNFIKQFLPFDILHYEVKIFVIVISFEILDNVGMVHLVHDLNLFYDLIHVISYKMLVQYFYRDMQVFILLSVCFVYFSKWSMTNNFGGWCDAIVLSELGDALLLFALVDLNRHSFQIDTTMMFFWFMTISHNFKLKLIHEYMIFYSPKFK